MIDGRVQISIHYSHQNCFSDVYKNRIGNDVARSIRFKALVGEYCTHLLGKKNRTKERANI